MGWCQSGSWDPCVSCWAAEDSGGKAPVTKPCNQFASPEGGYSFLTSSTEMVPGLGILP